MATRDPPWQEILDKLTRKAGKEGLLRSVKNAKTFEEKINKGSVHHMSKTNPEPIFHNSFERDATFVKISVVLAFLCLF